MEAEFPELKDPDVRDRLVENLTTAARSLVQKYYVDEMKGQLTALYDAWDHFPAADAASPGDPPLEDQFIATLPQRRREGRQNTAERKPSTVLGRFVQSREPGGIERHRHGSGGGRRHRHGAVYSSGNPIETREPG